MTDSYMLNLTTNLNNTTENLLPFVRCFPSTAVSVPLLELPANSLVIRLLLGKPCICSASEIFTLNLAVFDFLFCLIISIELRPFLYNLSKGSSNLISLSLNPLGGPLLLCLLCLDSYLTVCHPLAFLRLMAPQWRLLLCLAVNVLTAGFCLSPKFTIKYKWQIIIPVLIIVLIITSLTNIVILRSLSQSRPNRKEVHPVKTGAFKKVLTVMIHAHYMPSVVEYPLRTYGPISLFYVFISTTYMVSSSLCAISSGPSNYQK